MKRKYNIWCSRARNASLLVFLVTLVGPAAATDLSIEGFSPCHLDGGQLESWKTVIDNTSEAGGGPFDSPDTIVELEQMFGGEGVGIEITDGRLIHAVEPLDLPIVNPPPTKVGDPQAGTCQWVGEKLVCNVGMVPAHTSTTLRFYFVPISNGLTQVNIRVRGPLFDPNLDNNSQTLNMETVVSAKRLVYPWVSNNEGQFESILVANNHGEEDADVTLTARRADGSAETTFRSIPAKGALIEQASSLFPTLGSGSGYTVVLESMQQKLSGNWVTNNLVTGTGRSPSQGVAVDHSPGLEPYRERFGERILFGFLPVTDDLTSAPVIVNMAEGSADVALDFYDETGALVFQDILVGLEPFRPFATVANLLAPQGSGDLYMVATSTQRLTGVAFVFNSLGEPAIGNVIGLPNGRGSE